MIMEKQQLIEQLKELEEITELYDSALEKVKAAKDKLTSAELFVPKLLKEFDFTYKNDFIIQKIGEEPKSLGKWNPLNLSKKKRESVRATKEEYARKRVEAETEYYRLNENKRNMLKVKDEEAKKNRIINAKKQLHEAEANFDRVSLLWKQDELLSDRLRNSVVIRKLIEFFEDGRVDTMKEAVNLYYDEMRKDEEESRAAEHRERIETEIEQQNIVIQDLVNKMNKVTIMLMKLLGLQENRMIE